MTDRIAEILAECDDLFPDGARGVKYPNAEPNLYERLLLVDEVKRQRAALDAAQARVRELEAGHERSRKHAELLAAEVTIANRERNAAFRAGAEAMREKAANASRDDGMWHEADIRALPLPEHESEVE